MNSIINDDLRNSISRLKHEIKNDIYFFGVCGLVVGIMFIQEGRLKELGVLNNTQWARALFNDFLPGRAFGLILFVYIVLGMIANNYGCKSEEVKNILEHIGNRLYQFGSSIISFALGFSGFAFVYFLIRIEMNGMLLAVIAFLFASFFAEAISMADLLAQREKPFDKSLVFIGAVFSFNYLLMRLLAA